MHEMRWELLTPGVRIPPGNLLQASRKLKVKMYSTLGRKTSIVKNIYINKASTPWKILSKW